MFSFMQINDIHLSDRPPAARKSTYKDEVFHKLRQSLAYADRNDLDLVVLTGDIFHQRSPSRVSHDLVNTLIGVLHSCKTPIICVEGNHDLPHSKHSISAYPFTTLVEARCFDWLREPEVIGGIRFIPISAEDGTVFRELWSDIELSKDRVNVIVAHGPLFPPGSTAPFDYIDTALLDNKPSTLVVYGHIHDVHGIYRVRDMVYCNPGPLGRGEYVLEPEYPNIAIHRFEDPLLCDMAWKSDIIRAPGSKPAAEVFTIEQRETEVKVNKAMEDFIGSMSSISLEAFSEDELIKAIRHSDVDDDVKELAIQVLTE